MSYRDPLEALRAENESLKAELRSAREALDQSPAGEPEAERNRWALGVRCLGGLAMMAPFLLMTALCEHRLAPRGASYRAAMNAPAATISAPTTVPSMPGCAFAARPHVGFERFTRAVERAARVTLVSNVTNVSVGTQCTVRVAPVSLPDFNCHVDVICGGEVLYGVHPMGYAHCDVEGAAPVRARDTFVTAEDSDPAVAVDFETNEVVVEDRREGRPTRTVLRLVDPEDVTR